MRTLPPSGFSRAQGLHAFGLDVTFVRGDGCRLFYEDPDEASVVDFLGGYGATFFGHNHPQILETVRGFLDSGGVVHGQASRRAASEELCARLAQKLLEATGTGFEFTLANTGAEAVEAAVKHAELVFHRKRARLERTNTGGRKKAESLPLSPEGREILEAAGVILGSDPLKAVREHNRKVLGAPIRLVALQRSFHGLTARAREVTHDPRARFGPPSDSSRTVFVDPQDPGSLEELLRTLSAPVFLPGLRGSHWSVDRVRFTPVPAFIMEPLQGEGGIHPVDPRTARIWREVCTCFGVPLMADEVQSGMGRTGSFLFCEQLGIAPDYVILGKSLGGGLAKIGAVGVAHSEYAPEFTLQHSSTFAEDDLSSRVALRALDLLDEEEGVARARDIGERLLRELTEIARRYPTVVKEARGRGLMLGLEFRDLPFHRSNALRLMSQSGFLGYVLSGYLLKAHGVRVAPTLSGNGTLRIEPPFSVDDAAIRGLFSGLEALCALLKDEDSAGLLAPCLGFDPPERASTGVFRTLRSAPSPTSHVGFIGHFIQPTDVGLWDPGLSRLGAEGCKEFLERIHPFAEPIIVHQDSVRSVTGQETTLTFIGLPVASHQFHEALRSRERVKLRDMVQRGVEMAEAEGCSVVGLGGYCSIISRNGKDLRTNGIGITTGNGYTVAAGLNAMRRTASEQSIGFEGARAAVIGAAGNIGAILAEILAQEVGSLVLIGRPHGREELEALAGRLLWDLAKKNHAAPMCRAFDQRALGAAPTRRNGEFAAVYRRAKGALVGRCPIDVGFDLSLCHGADLIGAASNNPGTLLFPEHLNDKPVVIADLSVPADTHPSISERCPAVRVSKGGVVQTPCNPDWWVPGIPLNPGEMFACMTETVLMGLEGHRDHGSFGPLRPERVWETQAMAEKHGFMTVREKVERSY